MEELVYKICLAVKNNIDPNAEELGSDMESCGVAVEEAMNKGFIRDGYVKRNGEGDKVWSFVLKGASITTEGEKFINSKINK